MALPLMMVKMIRVIMRWADMRPRAVGRRRCRACGTRHSIGRIMRLMGVVVAAVDDAALRGAGR